MRARRRAAGWATALALTAAAALAAPAAGSHTHTYKGVSSQGRAALLKVDGSLKRLTTGRIEWRARCDDGGRVDGVLLLPRLKIDGDRRFRLVSEEGLSFAGRLVGRMARGTLEVETIEGCRSGPVRWSARRCGPPKHHRPGKRGYMSRCTRR